MKLSKPICEFFKRFDDAVARLSRSAFMIFLSIGFVGVAVVFDQKHGGLFTQADLFQHWTMGHVVYKSAIVLGILCYVAAFVQVMGVAVLFLEDEALRNKGTFAAFGSLIGGVLAVLIGFLMIVFAFAAYVDPDYRISIFG
ncbi:hypothetical protein [Paracoccus sp. (in: a-proteobacteria)]|uniref:hypothetical protein n=1 Tax=Paracoccus sp. TaxID=267 RepID=UPI003A86F712